MRNHYVRTSWIGYIFMWFVCLFVFLFDGRCEVSGDLFYLFWFLVPTLSSRRPAKDNGGRAAWRCQRECWQWQSDETQGTLKSLQTMIPGTLVQKVSDIENKYEELRGKAMDEYADSVCEHSMNTVPGRGEEEACGRAQMHLHHGPTGSAPMITKMQMAAPGAAARTHTETLTLSVKVISVSL